MPRSQKIATRPSHHANNSATSFVNPWASASLPTWGQLLQGSFPFGWYDKASLHSHPEAQDLKVVRPDWGKASLQKRGLDESKSKSECIIGTWLGHASTFVEFPPLNINEVNKESKVNADQQEPESDHEQQKSAYLLFDPIFSTRAGPTQYNGIARFKQSPCQVADLPGCDAVFVSHNHYDHLDTASIKDIFKNFPKARYFVPLGIKQWLLSTIRVSPELVIELDWWQDRELNVSDFTNLTLAGGSNEQQNKTTLKISCVPAQHNSGRSPGDQGSTLWCGWVVERLLYSTATPDSLPTSSSPLRKGVVYHAGDTGYRPSATSSSPVCPIFRTVGDAFGPLDLSFLPIWRGGSLGFISYLGLRLSHHDIPSVVHASPTDAADMHLDIKSKNTLGIHFGTFVGSANETVEARVEFAKACEERGIASLEEEEVQQSDKGKGRAGTVDLGESYVVEIM